MHAAWQDCKGRQARHPAHLDGRIDRTVKQGRHLQQPDGGIAADELRYHAQTDTAWSDDAGLTLRQNAFALFLAHPERKANEGSRRETGLSGCKSGVKRCVDLYVIFKHEAGIDTLLDDCRPRLAMREETGNLTDTHLEGIAWLVQIPAIDEVYVRVGQSACINGLDDFARNRKHRRKPFHLGQTVARAIQMNDESTYIRLIRLRMDRAQRSMSQLHPGMNSCKRGGGLGAEFISLHLGDLCVVSDNPLAVVTEGELRQT